MKIRTIISSLFLICITILFYFGYCEWDVWFYISSVLITVVFMFVFIRQQKKYTELTKQKNELDIM
ncbi:hypothetical protein [Anaerorhabdus furcosa]|uniref:Uncharacterized protein n=1 Tax=Anaerorhabdus furcosa TaxID=118967 RepID=A0A1T4QLB5_9FIRM|nr:hypothetical protein [Anaerorhabdus furcosa]SKA04058.1 hypothetical protein SAMN02745191_0045 [Anaerorhabdus furcosa]